MGSGEEGKWRRETWKGEWGINNVEVLATSHIMLL